MEEIEI